MQHIFLLIKYRRGILLPLSTILSDWSPYRLLGHVCCLCFHFYPWSILFIFHVEQLSWNLNCLLFLFQQNMYPWRKVKLKNAMCVNIRMFELSWVGQNFIHLILNCFNKHSRYLSEYFSLSSYSEMLFVCKVFCCLINFNELSTWCTSDC